MADVGGSDIAVHYSFVDNDDEGGTAISKNAISNNLRLAQIMLQRGGGGGVIVEVINIEQAKIAEEAGACCIVIHRSNSMPDLSLVLQIKQAVSIPVMVRVRVGHFIEASVLEALHVNCIDESELVGNPAFQSYLNKRSFQVLFACGCSNLSQALRRIMEGAAIIWIGESSAGETGLNGTVQNVMSIMQITRSLKYASEDKIITFAEEMEASYELVAEIKEMGKLPVVQIAIGGIETPADAALMINLGCDGVCVRSRIFESESWNILINPFNRIRAIVRAVKNYNNPSVLAECSRLFDNNKQEDDNIEDLT